jgi:hypothetical protein
MCCFRCVSQLAPQDSLCLIIMTKDLAGFHVSRSRAIVFSIVSAWIAVLAAMTRFMYRPVKVARSVLDKTPQDNCASGIVSMSASTVPLPTSIGEIGEGRRELSSQQSADETWHVNHWAMLKKIWQCLNVPP